VAQIVSKMWFVGQDPQLINNIEICFEMLDRVLKKWNLKRFFVVMLIYVNRYINKVGKLLPIHMFNVLFVSSVVTIKVWEDMGCLNSNICKLFNVKTQDLNVNELNFLTAIDYDLAVTAQDVTTFTFQVGTSDDGGN